MRKIPVYDLAPGTKFTKSVYLDKDTVLVGSKQPITQQDLDRLKQFGISFVLTEGEPILGIEDEKGQSATGPGLFDTNLPMMQEDEYATRCKYILDRANSNKVEFNAVFKDAFELVQRTYRSASEGKYTEIREFREVAERIADHVKNNPQLPILLLSHSHSGYYLYTHVCYATFFSVLLGNYLEFSRPKLIDLALASLFADIGMVTVPEEVSEKKGALTELDQKTIKRHPVTGYQILTQRLKLKNSLAIVSLQHHEAMDGSGYPQKILANQVEELTRVYSIADQFTSMISARPYRPALLPYDAMRIMISENVNRYDLKMVRLFLNKLSMFPIGSGVSLSDGRIGIVIDSNRDKPLRPIVRVTKDMDGNRLKMLVFVDLMQDLNTFIQKAIPFSQIY
ncbi:HD-GYP domain-containing response regulator [Leptospira ryugenii]|uniref:HD-GYP domain-containing response regulator n=1 Tax=Leptospira ryugenii TaxID=1917863 RepID=A0A2P2DWP9_9LEPT|nr:HD domain-containing phosphohydrolase [Leptospira ryugenii]GBF49065.1 HD-GYP domain-containing response regulator [Leptospira ryugenii]